MSARAANKPKAPATTTKEVAFIVDKSGSMISARQQVISGFNEFLQELKKEKLLVKLWLTYFDTIVSHPIHGVPVQDVPELAISSYVPGGMTALYDAIGTTLNLMEGRLANDKTTPITVIIMTDGHENSSREFTQVEIRAKVEALTGAGNWTFSFMGADQNAWDAAQPLGISPGNTMSYSSSETGATMTANTQSVIRHLRSGEKQASDLYTPASPPEPPTKNPYAPRKSK